MRLYDSEQFSNKLFALACLFLFHYSFRAVYKMSKLIKIKTNMHGLLRAHALKLGLFPRLFLLKHTEAELLQRLHREMLNFNQSMIVRYLLSIQ